MIVVHWAPTAARTRCGLQFSPYTVQAVRPGQGARDAFRKNAARACKRCERAWRLKHLREARRIKQ